MKNLINKKKYFNDLINVSIENNQYVGLGNPYSNILIVSKEAGINPDDEKAIKDYENNALLLKSNNFEYACAFDPPEKSNLRNANHTWQKYQKLYNLIIDEAPDKEYKINFIENVFTTELNNLPFKNTKGAKENIMFKEELLKRKEIFLNTPFIKSFPIVVIAALDAEYIKNVDDTREIDNIFDVVFEREEPCENSKDKYWVHKSKIESFPKLLIHTRQFTNGATNDLINKIGKEIRDFAKNNSINIQKHEN